MYQKMFSLYVKSKKLQFIFQFFEDDPIHVIYVVMSREHM